MVAIRLDHYQSIITCTFLRNLIFYQLNSYPLYVLMSRIRVFLVFLHITHQHYAQMWCFKALLHLCMRITLDMIQSGGTSSLLKYFKFTKHCTNC